ncbi:NrdH-redoxin [candidate division WWE3 bacterium CG22_combo_CG10-13_8_21_14_all_39_12]|uniref:NrdH-redoxin n=1 Tax=candidate division WWE3 bacterium CG22_combo_CG10-13_8_21_14_all_39_12 TaxID=1975094 RepID=A0A2H0BEY8_UNCKA|nr:NrdH-redoxin [bacterium]PIP56184.1 MAG: NrdH-redoxin [candidate division WWE3 bacterium CG22_combo_CG10-13_8_21_14_all_39_12]
MNAKSNTILFYGTPYCPDCIRSKAFLDLLGCEYRYINIAEDPSAAEKVVEINNGFQSIPTIQFPDGTVLVEPTNEELNQTISKLENENYIIHRKH